MNFNRILITGGAGFVGSNLAVFLRQALAGVQITVFDNLKRRGSELNLPRLKEKDISFIHGDIRCREDLENCPPFDLLLDCSAEPSVQAGLEGGSLALVQNNLLGTVHCLELARKNHAAFLFLSTSRIYPIEPLNGLPFFEEGSRFSWTDGPVIPGYSNRGIGEKFPLEGARSLYGATKLAAEILLQEYAWLYKMPVLINRCGILTGPWQMGKVDQGVVTLWVIRHLFQRPLRYIGFGGSGKQVRDILHVEDLFLLLLKQMADISRWDGRAYNVGGGREISVSLLELTELCQALTNCSVPVEPVLTTSPVDLRIYITDSQKVSQDFDWYPRKKVPEILQDILTWARHYHFALSQILGE